MRKRKAVSPEKGNDETNDIANDEQAEEETDNSFHCQHL